VFLRTAKNKERLKPSLARGNVEKTMSAPVTVIIAYDLQFYEKLPKLFPHNSGMRDLFAANPR
jgi:3-hydroxypropanoate dehydrogenase